MNYIEEVRQLLSKEIKVNNSLLNLYSLLVLVKGEETTLEDVHNAWALDKNRTFPEHRSLIPFYKLPYEIQIKDYPYVEAIKNVAKIIKERGN